jgi:hypothetical protein
VEPRRQWGEGGGTPVISLLKNRELEAETGGGTSSVNSETCVVFTKWPDSKPPLAAAAATYRVSAPYSDDVDAPSGNVTVPSGDAPVPSDDGAGVYDDKISQMQEKGVVTKEATPLTPEPVEPSGGVVKEEAMPFKQKSEEVTSSPVGGAQVVATPTPEQPRTAWGEPSGGPEIPPETAPSPAAPPQQSAGEILTVEDIEMSDPQEQGSGGPNLDPHHSPPQAHSTPEKKTSEEEEDDETEAQPSSPASFHTASSRPADSSSRLSQSLRDGDFDTRKHLLRTCSLPNLQYMEEEKAGNEAEENVDYCEEEEEEGVEEVTDTVDRENELPLEATPTGDEVDGEGVECEGEERDDGGEEEEDFSESEEDEDDDLHQLVKTLQNFVRESKTPPCSPARAAASDFEPVTPLDESWVDSDEDEGGDGRPASSGSVFSQLEKTRVELETKVGMESLLQAYQLIQTLQDEGEADEEGEFPMAQLTAIVGAQNADMCPAIIHLTLADSAYSLLAPPTSEEAKDVERVEVEVEG